MDINNPESINPQPTDNGIPLTPAQDVFPVPYHKHTGTDSPRISANDIEDLLIQPIFGDGSDGSVVVTVNTTLTRDMYYQNLTVGSGVVISPAGFRIFVKDKLL